MKRSLHFSKAAVDLDGGTRSPITPEQASRSLLELPPHQLEIALVALATGLRQSNILKLVWDQVDLNRNTA